MSSRRTWILLGLLALLGSIGTALWMRSGGPSTGAGESARDVEGRKLRVVSLSPGVTETIDALGAAHQLIGVSDYCPVFGDRKLPRAGSALTPNYETIAELAPDAIVTSEVKGEMLVPLEKLATTHRLPWLSLAEWRGSIITLGKLLGRKREAARLEEVVATTLDVKPPTNAPRVLLALDYGDSGSDETWFIRKNSIHGAVLHAAGAKNAVGEEIAGHPKLSPEQLLALDPDMIVVLTSSSSRTRSEVRNHFGKWSPLRAVKHETVGLVAMPRALDVGPSVLKLVPLLEKELRSLQTKETR